MKNFHSVARLISLLAISLTIGCESSRPPYNAVVDPSYDGEQGAVLQGAARFTSIGDAIESVPPDNPRSFVVLIRSGTYREKLVVDRQNVHFVGENREQTVISFGDSGDSLGPDGKPLGTWGSFTLKIIAPGFQAENLTIENTFDYPANAAKSDDDSTKVHNPQAVAVMTDTGSDRVVFRNCTILGYQDTLFLNAGRHYLVGCRIAGHVDFIFGAGQAYFEKCDIVSRSRIDKNPSGYLTAPSTLAADPYGFVFVESRLVKESPQLEIGSVRLGRPWHPNADPDVNGSAVFIDCYMDDHVGPEGYAPISSRDADGNRIWFEVGPESRFFEYGSEGPGAVSSPNRPTLDPTAVTFYSIDNVLDGWRP